MKKINRIQKPRFIQLIIWLISIAIAIGLFFFAKNFTACWRITPLPGDLPQSCQINDDIPQTSQDETPLPDSTSATDKTPEPTDISASAPTIEPPPPWDGVERVTALIIGLDYRDWEANAGAPRSDTMMLLTIDPLNKKAGMFSIPRDMWVNIPDFGYNRINTAYSLGESWKLPGGGPGLAIKTVEDFLGTPITYYAQVDFHVFERVIDEIGGVIVTPDQEVALDRIGDGDIPVTLEAGETYALPGDLALAYARNRKTKDGDVDRAKRQQDVILGIKDRILNNFSNIVPKVIPLYNELSAGINTNMSIDDAIRFMFLFIQNQDIEIQRGVIDYTMAVPVVVTLPDGGGTAEVLKPIPDQIRILRDQLFETGGALSPLAEGDLNTLITDESARVSVYSSIAIDGISSRTVDYFTNEGLNTVSAGNSSVGSLKTIVVDHTGNPYTLKFLMEKMNLDNSQIIVSLDFNASVDVEVHIGNDWASNNPMP